ncbi:DUF1802 family protein [Paenibacillus eucommiae]|uniref:DUF1802 family protein n=1 Tax=Paenibacillus eucommiae TaxID=1355755 RepID=A0ABS4J7S4_9BACL|nr:DUF1802 family protein [Paenibacillus eucommiae]MBP1995882.1 hypothetical protein [Paenibacillus eucommiae]
MSRGSIALKEWAIAVKELVEGTQIFIMRKGGIEEETRDFEIHSHEFYLYPTYEHQKKDLLKEPFRSGIDDTLEGWNPNASKILITAYAKLVEDLEINDSDKLEQLYPLHIWNHNFTTDRLRWKQKNPLLLMLLRVYKLSEPLEVEIQDTYLGCKSWIHLPDSYPDEAKENAVVPVVNDVDFAARVREIKDLLINKEV